MRRFYEAEINGDLTAIYQLVAGVEKWPDLFPHVLAADVLWEDADVRVARVRVSRSGIPLAWVCRLEIDPSGPRVHVDHIDGFARGLRADWKFERLPQRRTRVRLVTDYHTRLPTRDRLITRYVLDDLVARTLAMITLLAESDRAAHELFVPGVDDGARR